MLNVPVHWMKHVNLNSLVLRGFCFCRVIDVVNKGFHYGPLEALPYSRGTEEADVFEVRNTPEMPLTTCVRL